MEADITSQAVGLASSADFSLLNLFIRADIIVKSVIVLLIACSIYSWAVIIEKIRLFKKINLSTEEKEFENNLRPSSFDDFSGQDQVIENLKIFVQASNQRGDALDHTLFHGPPGLGKTTLAHILAHELEVAVKVTSGPVLDKPADLAGLLTNLEERDVLFIDEIHRLSPVVEEYLYSAMEDYKIDIMIESGPNARSRIRFNCFTNTSS